MKLYGFICCSLLIGYNCVNGKPTEDYSISSTTTENSNSITNDEGINVMPNSTENNLDNSTEVNGTLVDRAAHARMSSLEELFRRSRTTTTTTSTVVPVTEYNYWWYFTTPRRPRFSYRDFPGKPGVATWKEISPAVVKETKKADKSLEPTAEGVLGTAHAISSVTPLAVIVYTLLIRLGFLFLENI